MVKNHLKRLNAPRGWSIKRKGLKFITRPAPGPHNLENSIALNIVMRDMLKCANTTKEVKHILNNRTVLINGIRRKDHNFPVGLFDVIEIKETKEYFRILLDDSGCLKIKATDKTDAELVPYGIKSKNKVKGKTQLNLSDGSNMLVDKDEYKTGDTLILNVPKKEIKKLIRFDKKATVYLIGGKYVGKVGVIEDIKSDKVTYKLKDVIFETLRDYVFVVGEDKPLIKIENESDETSKN